MVDFNLQKFEETRKNAELFYKTVGKVYCPYFGEMITFNAKGWEHIRFNAPRQARAYHDQYIRFRLISLAPQIIKISHTLQGVSRRKQFEREKTHSRWENVKRNIIYYEFVTVIKDVRVRVIVKQVEDGPKYFWSIIPFWKSDKYKNIRFMHSGKPETD